MPNRRNLLAEATRWITELALDGDAAALPARVAERAGCTRRAALTLLRQLEASGWLLCGGTPRRPSWQPGALRQVVRSYALEGLDEDRAWRRDFAARFALPPTVARIAQHAFGELVNNAVDHSGGSRVTVSLRQTPLQLQLLVADDGCGLFERVQQAFSIDEPLHAMLELSKGRLTSDPARHAGRGLVGLARLADYLDLHANAQAFQHRGSDARRWQPARALASTGTAVYFAVALDTPRTVDDAWLLPAGADAAQIEPAERTARVPLALLADGPATGIDSRAQARRVAARLAKFRRAEIDFDGIPTVGHGFADELFRVFAREFPKVELVPLHANARVAAMLDAVRAG